jgi:metal-responsive CopG/Arc/MetJ family transcriptional regulator
MQSTEKVTLTIPKETMNQVREAAPVRGYSKFVTEAIEYFLEENRKKALRERLIAGYQANAEADAAMAEDWRPVEEEAWSKIAPYEDE